MGQKLPESDMELYKRTDEVLHYIWDPIGVSGAAEARGEYYPYLPEVFGLLKSGANSEKIAGLLISISQNQMGLTMIPILENRAEKAANILLRYRMLSGID